MQKPFGTLDILNICASVAMQQQLVTIPRRDFGFLKIQVPYIKVSQQNFFSTKDLRLRKPRSAQQQPVFPFNSFPLLSIHLFDNYFAVHLSKIQHIIRFIEDNYDKNISRVDLEAISNSSYRNLHRIFKSVFREPIGAFQKRLKLENAYKKIIYTNNQITDIAIEVGFESIHSFSKSFKKQFNISPSNARKEKIGLFNTFFKDSNSKHKEIDCEIIYLNQKKVFFKAIQTNNYNNDDINILWDKIDAEISSDSNINYYGVIVDEPLITDKSKCRYEACIDKEIVLEGLYFKNIFGGRYAKFIHNGNYNSIENTYRKIYYDWLFNSSLEFDSSPIIEYYTISGSNEKDEKKFVTEILIPIRKK